MRGGDVNPHSEWVKTALEIINREDAKTIYRKSEPDGTITPFLI